MIKKSEGQTPAYYLLSIMIFVLSVADAANAATTIYELPPTSTDFMIILSNFLKWFLSVAGAIALVMLIIAGMMYMTSAGDPQKAAAAKKMVLITLGGLILTLLSYSILVILNNILT